LNGVDDWRRPRRAHGHAGGGDRTPLRTQLLGGAADALRVEHDGRERAKRPGSTLRPWFVAPETRLSFGRAF